LKNTLLHSTVHVWHLHAATEHPAYERHLAPDELARAERFHDPRHGSQWRYFHCALRQILASYTDSASHALRFASIERDKPVLADFPALYFNLSHAAGQALLAVTTAAEVGIDIERERKLHDFEAMTRRYFSAREQQQLNALETAEKSSAFFRIWTRKEAVIKANGLGLGIALESFDVPCGPLPRWRACQIRKPANGNSRFRLQEVKVAAGHAGAIALQSSGLEQDTEVSLQHFTYKH
jgi:4'-phosphopantetheinyl transferase